VLQKGLRPAVVRLYDELDTLMSSFSHQEAGAEADAERVVAGPRPPVETGALPAWPGPPPEEAEGMVARLIALAKGKHLRQGAIHAALGQSQLVNRLVGTVAEKIARGGCRLIMGAGRHVDPHRGRGRAHVPRAGGRGRARQGRGSGLGVAAPPLRGVVSHVAGVSRTVAAVARAARHWYRQWSQRRWQGISRPSDRHRGGHK